MSTAFVIGNGVSRTPVPIERLKDHGTVYGCNALYRDFTPNHLIAVDEKMLKELDKTECSCPIWTYYKDHRKKKPYQFFPEKLGWSSGPSALNLSTIHGHSVVYILGFDYSGIDRKINNIYAGTNNYRGKDSIPTYYRNWLWQTQKVIGDNPEVKFIRVIDENCLGPNSFSGLGNLSHESVSSFLEKVQNGRF